MEECFDLYDVSIDGIVTNRRTGLKKKPFVSDKGYYKVQLIVCGKKRNVRVHRLVAFKYLSNPHGYSAINHIDGNKLNNSISNLEWCTNSHNILHGIETGLIGVGECKVNAKMSREDVLEARLRRDKGEGYRSIYKDYSDKIGWWSFRDIMRNKSYKRTV